LSGGNSAAAILYLIFYILGLALVLFVVAFFGQKVIGKLKWAANPHGIFRRSLGVLLVIVGIGVMFGLDKELETWLLQQEFYLDLIDFENAQVEDLILM
jgi:uncharacterized SAM-binding protein YcdF (DUF218 family)